MPDNGNMAAAQVIGGVVVTIGADTSRLRAGHAEAKAVAQQIEAIQPTVKIRMEMPKLALPAPPTVPLLLDLRQATAQVGDFKQKISAAVTEAVSSANAAAAAITGKLKTAANYSLPNSLDPKWIMNAVAKVGSLKSKDLINAVLSGAIPPHPGTTIYEAAAPAPAQVAAASAKAGLPQFGLARYQWPQAGPQSSTRAHSMPDAGPGTALARRYSGGGNGGGDDVIDAEWEDTSPRTLAGYGGGPAGPGDTTPGRGRRMWAYTGINEGTSLWKKAKDKLTELNDMGPNAIHAAFRIGVAARLTGSIANFAADSTDRMIGPRVAIGNTLKSIDSFAGNPAQNFARLQDNLAEGDSGFARFSSGVLAGGPIGGAITYATGRSLGENIVHGTNALGLTNTMTGQDEKQFADWEKSRDRREAAQQIKLQRVQGFTGQRLGLLDQTEVAKADSFDQGVKSFTTAFNNQNQQDFLNRDPRNRAAYNETLGRLVDESTRAKAYAGETTRIGNADLTLTAARDRAVATGGMSEQAAGRAAIAQGTDSQLSQLRADYAALAPTETTKRANIASTIQAVIKAGNDQLAAYDATIKKQSDDIKASAGAATRSSLQRIGGNTLGATITDITEAFRVPLREAIKRGDGSASKIMGQQAAAVGEAQTGYLRADYAGTSAVVTAGASSLLRRNKREQSAQLVDFDSETKAQLDQLQSSGASYVRMAATRISRAIQRGTLVAGQDEQDKNQLDTLRGRRDSADALVRMAPNTANVIGLLAGQRVELRSAQADMRVATAQAQISELQAARSQLLMPNQYAMEGDRFRDVPGGPSGLAGRDTAEAASKLSDAIKMLTDYLANQPKGLRP